MHAGAFREPKGVPESDRALNLTSRMEVVNSSGSVHWRQHSLCLQVTQGKLWMFQSFQSWSALSAWFGRAKRQNLSCLSNISELWNGDVSTSHHKTLIGYANNVLYIYNYIYILRVCFQLKMYYHVLSLIMHYPYHCYNVSKCFNLFQLQRTVASNVPECPGAIPVQPSHSQLVLKRT